MNYQQHYKNLINSRKNRKLYESEYYEKHHIIPKCLGGTNDKSNLIYLTAREHFIAHWLLWKMSKLPGDKIKMSSAFIRMATMNNKNERRITAKQYEIARKVCAEGNKYRKASDETRQKMSETMKRKFKEDIEYKIKQENREIPKRSEESKQRTSKALKGKPKSEEAKENMRKAWEKRRLTPVSDETKEKMSKAHKGLPKSDETRQKLSEALKGHEVSEKSRQVTSERRKGARASEETRKKMSESHKKHNSILTPNQRKSIVKINRLT